MTEPSLQEIIDVQKNDTSNGYWLILDCGHWYKWTGKLLPKIGDEFRCPWKHE